MKKRLAGALALALLSTACATVAPPPPMAVVEEARAVRTYSAELRVGLRGPGLRGRASVIVGFVRPDRLRLEMPGPTGARFILVVNEKRLTAAFPGARAIFEGEATPATLARITGVRLASPAVMDLLLGMAPADVTGYRADWAERVPKRVRATLSDGTRLYVKIARP
jgi:hypothetical protein